MMMTICQISNINVLIDKYIKGIRFLLPTPFTISAILLTLFTLLAYFWPNVAIDEI